MKKTKIKKRLLQATFIVSLLTFFTMAYLLINNKTALIDNKGYALATWGKNDNITNVFKFLSSLCVYILLFSFVLYHSYSLKTKTSRG